MQAAGYILVGINVELPEGLPPYTPGKDYTQVAADCCGSLVWVGPTQLKYREEHPGTPLVCALCTIAASSKAGLTQSEILANVKKLT